MPSPHPKQILQQYGLSPKKSLGQNFLFDEGILARIISAAGVNADDEVLEIGPGLGALTRELAKTAQRVVAVELDERFLPILQTEFGDLRHVKLVHGDILDQNPADLFAGPYKVIANVPYYITGAILRHLLTARHKPTLLVLTVQREVAKRLTAVPPKMSVLGVSAQFYGRPQQLMTIKAGAFWPRPAVDSAVIALEIHQKSLLPYDAEREFFRLVKIGFSQKRKQLKNNLRQTGLKREKIQEILIQSQVDGHRRAETLTIQEWLTLFHNMQNNKHPEEK
jgi:16S rRNA (adenine1518-N6/adenine1519-N6)-dimethyltransferase